MVGVERPVYSSDYSGCYTSGGRVTRRRCGWLVSGWYRLLSTTHRIPHPQLCDYLEWVVVLVCPCCGRLFDNDFGGHSVRKCGHRLGKHFFLVLVGR